MCRRRDSNSHETSSPAPKAGVYTNFTTPASLCTLAGVFIFVQSIDKHLSPRYDTYIDGHSSPAAERFLFI